MRIFYHSICETGRGRWRSRLDENRFAAAGNYFTRGNRTRIYTSTRFAAFFRRRFFANGKHSRRRAPRLRRHFPPRATAAACGNGENRGTRRRLRELCGFHGDSQGFTSRPTLFVVVVVVLPPLLTRTRPCPGPAAVPAAHDHKVIAAPAKDNIYTRHLHLPATPIRKCICIQGVSRRTSSTRVIIRPYIRSGPRNARIV